MDARAVTVRELLQHEDSTGSTRPVQYRVPIFQRAYSWGPEQIEQLLANVLDRATGSAGDARHFIGAFVLMEEDDEPGGPDRLMVIDGQQRLLTIALTVTHLERRMGLVPSILVNPSMGITGQERVEPAEVDHRDFEDIREGRQAHGDRGLPRAFATITRVLASSDPALVLDAVLDRLEVVRVRLDRTEDAETVFESLNTTGLRLSQADLVRTVLLAQFARLSDQQTFDTRYWRPMEHRLRDAVPDRRSRERSSPKDRVVSEFVRHTLMRSGQRVDGWRTYRTFVERLERSPQGAIGRLRELDDLSEGYVRLLATEPRSGRADVYQRLRLLGYNVHWPLYLRVYEKARAGTFPVDQVDQLLEGLESFFVRRIAAGWPTNILGRRFEAICRLDPESVEPVWQMLAPDWPGDEKFARSIRETPIYRVSWGGCRLMLQRLDMAYGHPESQVDDDASIEHVMPQSIGSDERGRAWKAMLGPDWERIHRQWLHTLPNLSITKTNSAMSNRPFVTNDGRGKRDWYRESLFEMNHRIAANDSWGEPQLEARADEFVRNAMKLWPLPQGITGWKG
jgi:hypothetical protein